MPTPERPTTADKMLLLEAMARQQQQQGVPPTGRVLVALNSFGDVPPTPEEIKRATNDFLRTGDPASAMLFQVYAQESARAANVQRQAAQRKYDAGVAPSPAAAQALASFGKTPPTPEQVQALGNYLRSTHGSDVAQEFETYAASEMAKLSAPRPPGPGESGVIVDDTGGGGANVEVTIGQAQDIRPQGPAATQAGPGESKLLALAQETLGRTIDREAIGRDVAAVKNAALRDPKSPGGFGPIPKKKGKEEPKRDLNKERDLLNAAKEVHDEPRRGKTDTTPVDIEDLKKRQEQIYEDDIRQQFYRPPYRRVDL